MLKTSFETTDWVIMKKLKNQLQLAIIMKDKNHICDLCPSSFFYIYMLLCSGSQKSHLMYVAITDRCSISHAMLRRSVFPLWRSSIEKTVFFFFFLFLGTPFCLPLCAAEYTAAQVSSHDAC